jgi:hypothetical protein
VLAPRYAGDTVRLSVERAAGQAKSEQEKGEQAAPPSRIDVQVTLVKALPPWRRPILGIVPVRSAAREPRPGPVKVAWVWAGSPAAKAGIAAGDRIEAVVPPLAEGDTAGAGDAIPVDSASALAGIVAGTDVGKTLGLVVDRDGKRQTLSIESVAMPADLPDDLLEQIPPFAAVPAAGVAPAGDAAGDAVTVERLQAAEVAQPPLAVLPSVGSKEPLGVIVFLDVPRGPIDDAQAAEWKAAAARHGVAVILPGSVDPQRWGREDIGGIKRALATLAAKQAIDPARIAVVGRGAGGAFAWLVAESLGPAVRGVALIDSALPRQATIEPAEPGRSRWVLFGTAANDGAADVSPRMEADRRRLDEAGSAAGTLPMGQGGRVPAATLAAWVESLGLL